MYPTLINSRQKQTNSTFSTKAPMDLHKSQKVPTDPNEPPMNQDAKDSADPGEPKLTKGSINPNWLKTQT